MLISSFWWNSSALAKHNLPLFGGHMVTFGGFRVLSLRARRRDGFCVRDGAGLRNSCLDWDGYALGDEGCGSRGIGDRASLGDCASDVNSCWDVIGHSAGVSHGIVIRDGACHIDCCRDPISHSARFRDRAIVGCCFPHIDRRRYIVRDSAIFSDRWRANWGRLRPIGASSFDSGGWGKAKRKSESNNERGVHYWVLVPKSALSVRFIHCDLPTPDHSIMEWLSGEGGMKG